MPQQPLETREENRLGQAARRRRMARHRIAWWLLCVPLLALVSGCGGCGEASPPQELSEREKAEEARKEQEKAAFLLGNLRTEPNGLEERRGTEVTIPLKPGHWTSATLVALANRENLDGEITTSPLPLNDMDFSLGAVRGATLAKGEAKQLEFMFFAPEGREDLELTSHLATASGRTLVTRNDDDLLQMPSHQFFFLVLAADPDRYSFWRTLDSVRAPTGYDFREEFDTHYRVLLPRVKTRVPLPSSALTWTSLAYLLWDRFDPARLTPAQTQALLDWLHWGGQIIVSGPDSLDVLAAGFLKPYVPADPGGTALWKAEDLAELSVRDWTMAGPRLADDREWTGVELQLRPEAEVLVATDDRPLVVERRVGRGRIVVTAFSLAEHELRDWPKFDTLLNACLLRRPARKFSVVKAPSDAQAAGELQPEAESKVEWADGRSSANAVRNSQFRIFSRDTVKDLGTSPWHIYGDRERDDTLEADIDPFAASNLPPPLTVGPGVAGWDNENDVAIAARESLRKASGIMIPDAKFVIQVLALYLAVLVPLNWAVFRLLGRVELAWIAVPILSVVFTVLVVRWAQLDIGFARAEADLSVVELYEGYDRAHVTHYTALYTSLATRFAAVFEGAAVSQPLPVREVSLGTLGREELFLRQGATTRLEGFEVASNSTRMLHSEQMRDAGGGIRLSRAAAGGWQVVNESRLTLRGAGVLGPEGAAWIGDLAQGQGAVLEFASYSADSLWRDERARSPQTAGTVPEDVLSVRRMFDMAVNSYDESSGELQLVAWTETDLGGMSIEPAASQRRQTSLVVAHLQPPPLAEPADDEGTPYKPKRREQTLDDATGAAPTDAAPSAAETREPQP